MNDIDALAFNERLAKCAQKTHDLVAFLRTVAAHAGPGVGPPTCDNRGIGMTFWTNGKRFCRFDPKTGPDHVWALIPNDDRHALSEVGSVSEREDGPWVTITTMRGAVRLVPHILRAYDAVEREVERRR